VSKRLGWDRDPRFDFKNNWEPGEFSFNLCVGIGCVLLIDCVALGFIDFSVFSSFMLKMKEWQDGVPLFSYRKFQILDLLYNKER
jgi:hypothetical protein